MEAIVLAGGLGTRLRSVVSDVPKPMAPIHGRPFLKYLLDYWIEQGVSHFVLSIGHQASTIQGSLGDSYRGIPIDYSVESSPLGTGGALFQAGKSLKKEDPFLLLNGDTFFQVDLQELTKFYREKEADGVFSLFSRSAGNRYGGISLDSENRILEINGKSSSHSWINGGVYLLNKRLLGKEFGPGLPDLSAFSFETDVLPQWINKGVSLFGLSFDSLFIDIGVPEDYFRASQILTKPSVS